MPRLVWSDTALRDLTRLYDFLAEKNRGSAPRAIRAIRLGGDKICEYPEIGRQVIGFPSTVRERVIAFGGASYVVRYLVGQDEVVILAIRHGREDGYGVGPPFAG